jgi:hypothetical protein
MIAKKWKYIAQKFDGLRFSKYRKCSKSLTRNSANALSTNFA